MTDLLNMAHINNLPQPLFVRDYGSKDWWWPVYDIDAETGAYRIDVCGKLDAKHISGAAEFRDANGVVHDSESFYLESESAAIETPSHD